MVDHVNLKIAHRYWDNQPKICSSPPPLPSPGKTITHWIFIPPNPPTKKQFSS